MRQGPDNLAIHGPYSGERLPKVQNVAVLKLVGFGIRSDARKGALTLS